MADVQGISFIDIWRSEGGLGMKAVKTFDHLVGGAIARLLPQAKPAALSARTRVRRVLVIRPGGIGDAVFLLPVLRMLKIQGIEVDVLCERRNSEVFASQPGLCGKVLRYDVLPEFLTVFRGAYDVVVDTEQWHYLSAVTAYFVKTPLRAGFATRAGRARLFHMRIPYSQDDHELVSFTNLFSFLGVKGPLVLEGSFKPGMVPGQIPSGKFIVLGLGGSIPARRFTPEQVRQISEAYVGKGYDVVLAGGKDVMRADAPRGDARIHDRRGQLTLAGTAAVISKAQLFIGHDSGVAHLAVAVGTKTVMVFGPGNRKKWAPRDPKHKVVVNDVPCAPCTRFGYTMMVCKGQMSCLFGGDISKLGERVC